MIFFLCKNTDIVKIINYSIKSEQNYCLKCTENKQHFLLIMGCFALQQANNSVENV